MSDPRRVAVQALYTLHKNDGYSNLVLDRAMERAALPPRDRALTAALFYGVLERRITVDYILGKFVNRSLDRLPPMVLEILRIGVYQLYFMRKIPEAAAVDEAVKLCRALAYDAHAAFVNGVLRTAARERKNLRYPNEKTARLKFLSVKHSCPEELISFWQSAYGEAHTEGLLGASLGRPPLTVRVNTLKTTAGALIESLAAEGIEARRPDILPHALILSDTASLARTKAYQDGLFHVQDLASQLCCEALGAQPGETVYDVCAAPGGKSFTTAQRMENRGVLRAFDLYDQKVALMATGAERLGLTSLTAQKRDAAAKGEALPPADRVLCDLPCSGLGVIRRKPEIKYKSISEFDELPALQLSILINTAPLVKPGGRLLYSTCTLSPAENHSVAEAFRAACPAFAPEPLRLPGSCEWAVDELAHERTLLPHIHGTDGFFMAGFRKGG